MMDTIADNPAADVIAFPREGFIIGEHICRAPGPERHLACFAERGHDGDHQWSDWRGCRVRVPQWSATVPFMGFAS
jgi:hypothetical protein